MHKRIFYTFFVTVFTIKAMEIPQFTDNDYATYCAIRLITDIYKPILENAVKENKIHELKEHVQLFDSRSLTNQYLNCTGLLSSHMCCNCLPFCVISKWGVVQLFEFKLSGDKVPIPKTNRIDFFPNDCRFIQKIKHVDAISLSDVDIDTQLIYELSQEKIKERKKQWAVLTKKFNFEQKTLKILCLTYIKKNQNSYNFHLHKLPQELKEELSADQNLLQRKSL